MWPADFERWWRKWYLMRARIITQLSLESGGEWSLYRIEYELDQEWDAVRLLVKGRALPVHPPMHGEHEYVAWFDAATEPIVNRVRTRLP